MKKLSIMVVLAAIGLAILTTSTAGAATLSTRTTSTGPDAPAAVGFVQAAAISPGTRSTSLRIPFTHAVTKGDLLVGWFGQYNSLGQVSVSDAMNGQWIRTASSEKFANGNGDLALFYTYAKLSALSLTITTHSLLPTYLPSTVAEYRGLPAGTPPTTAAVAEKDIESHSTRIVAGPTATVPAGDLVFGAEICGGQPATFTVGSTQGVPFTQRAINSDSAAAGVEDVLSGAAGGQNSSFTVSSPTDWYSAVAVFAP